MRCAPRFAAYRLPDATTISDRCDAHIRPWHGIALVVSGWMTVWLTRLASVLPEEPKSASALVLTLALSSLALTSVAIGAALAVNAATSPANYVFRSSPTLWIAATFFGLGGAGFAFVVLQSPFDGLAAHGMPLVELVSGLTIVAAAVTCLVGGLVAVTAGLRAYRIERACGRPQPSAGAPSRRDR